MSNKSYRQRVAQWLREQGHRAKVEVHDELQATVHFRSRGTAFAVRVHESDRGFLFLSLGYSLPDALPDAAAPFALARDLERRLKVVKIVVDGEHRRIEFNAEQLIVECDVAPVFWRCADLMATAADQFFAELHTLAPSDPAQKFIDEVGRDLGLAT